MGPGLPAQLSWLRVCRHETETCAAAAVGKAKEKNLGEEGERGIDYSADSQVILPKQERQRQRMKVRLRPTTVQDSYDSLDTGK